MTAQTPRRRTPKTVVRVDAEARFVSGPPRSPPTIEAAAKASTTGQSTFECVPTRAGPRPRALFTPLPCLSPGSTSLAPLHLTPTHFDRNFRNDAAPGRF